MFLTGRCLPYGEGITFWPLRELVRQAGGGDDSPEKDQGPAGRGGGRGGVAEQLHRAFGPVPRAGQQPRRSSGPPGASWRRSRGPGPAGRLRGPALGRPTFLDLVESLALQPGDRRSPGLHRPPRNCSTSVQPGRPRPTGRFPSSSRRSATTRPQRCLTPCPRVSASPVHPRAAYRHRRRQSALPGATGSLPQRAGRKRHPAGAAAHDSGVAFGTTAAPRAGSQQRPRPGRHHRQGLRRAGSPGAAPGRGARPAEPQPPDPRRQGPGAAAARAEAPWSSTASGTSSSRRRPTARSPSPFGPSCTTASPTGSRPLLGPLPGRTEILGYHLEQSVRYRTELWPADGSPVRCRAGRPRTSRRPGAARMTAATTSRR